MDQYKQLYALQIDDDDAEQSFDMECLGHRVRTANFAKMRHPDLDYQRRRCVARRRRSRPFRLARFDDVS